MTDECVDPVKIYRIPSRSEKGKKHVVIRCKNGRLQCSCGHFQNVGTHNGTPCFHIGEAIKRGILR